MLDSIEAALSDLKAGRMIIVVDDENRENEGDFVIPAEMITSEDVNFMTLYGRGLICAPVSSDVAARLELCPMVANAEDCHSTAFTVSIDAACDITTGISVRDRAITLSRLSGPNIKASDFVRPGHIFPLIAKDGGVEERPGHTEAAVDLAKLCGFAPVGVICEILNPDGTCARLPQLKEIANQFNFKIISIEELILYKKQLNTIKQNSEESHANVRR